ncbi:hypothetical protein A0H81_10486 [Grifola frondosa]|uniref:Uncharacterized protein n=1 Tax=Grifola frondosa TaxID=5627 RepID=A0A1C7LYJ7_GRIFR|nr:hypothetical protein A0H81_10486 [Grifola frondosa]
MSKSVSWCDERFTGYGGNKAACLFEMYLSGVSFYVLADHFIIHQSHKYEEEARKEERKYNRKLYSDFKEETCLRYIHRYLRDGTLHTPRGFNVQEECKKIKNVARIAAQVSLLPLFMEKEGRIHSRRQEAKSGARSILLHKSMPVLLQAQPPDGVHGEGKTYGPLRSATRTIHYCVYYLLVDSSQNHLPYRMAQRGDGLPIRLDTNSLYIHTIPLDGPSFHWAFVHVDHNGTATRHQWAPTTKDAYGPEAYVEQSLPTGPGTLTNSMQILGYFRVTDYNAMDITSFRQMCSEIFSVSYPTAQQNRQAGVTCRTWVTHVLGRIIAPERAQEIEKMGVHCPCGGPSLIIRWVEESRKACDVSVPSFGAGICAMDLYETMA